MANSITDIAGAARVDKRYHTLPLTLATLPQLLGQVSVKNTFIEVQELEKPELQRSNTEPFLASRCETDDGAQEESAKDYDATQEPESAQEQAPDEMPGSMEKLLAHRLGKCTPCSYYFVKEDGCRMGDDCKFCHLCTAKEVKGKRQTTKKEMRAQKRKDEAVSHVPVSSTLRCQLPLGHMFFRRPVASSEQAR